MWGKSTTLANDLQRGMSRNAQQPGREAGFLAERGQMFHRTEKGLLGDILGVLFILQHPARQRIHDPLMARGQQFECLQLTGLGAPHQLRVSRLRRAVFCRHCRVHAHHARQWTLAGPAPSTTESKGFQIRGAWAAGTSTRDWGACPPRPPLDAPSRPARSRSDSRLTGRAMPHAGGFPRGRGKPRSGRVRSLYYFGLRVQ